jgi:ubiquinone/menaquinone biosynthesis C-methylase UbiE
MADHVCPPFIGRLLLSPLRKLVENPKKIFTPFVKEGMTVLEPGCAMGFFTLPLARMVGPEGKVVAVDIQTEMLTTLERRARRKGLIDRIDVRQADEVGLGVADLAESVDLCTVFHVAHEVPDRNRFLDEISRTLKAGARLLLIEPGWHVSEEDFMVSLAAAEKANLRKIDSPHVQGPRKALFERAGE